MDVVASLGAMALDSAQQGSDRFLSSAGRLVGLGPAEFRAAFGQAPGPAVPRWALLTLGLAGGVVLGAYLQRRWPAKVGRLFGG